MVYAMRCSYFECEHGSALVVFKYLFLLEMASLLCMDRYGGYSDSYDRGRGHSRSPDRHDRVPPTRERSPVQSFHQAMIERGRATSPAQYQRERSRSPRGGGNNSHKVPNRERSPACSFHQAMMERSQASPPSHTQSGRSRSPYGGGSSSQKVSTREQSPVRSFHQAMMERNRASPPSHSQSGRSRSPSNGSGSSFHTAMAEKGRSSSNDVQQDRGRSTGSEHEDRAYNDASRSRFGEEEEEGMIPADEDGIIPPDDEGMYGGADGNFHCS